MQRVHYVRDFYGGVSVNPFKKFRFRLEGEQKFRKVGSFGNRIRPYLATSPEAIKHLNRYSAKRAIAAVGTLAQIGFFGAFVIKNFQDLKESQRPSGAHYKGYLGAAIGAMALQLVMGGTSNKNMIHAVDAYHQSKGIADLKFVPLLKLSTAGSYQSPYPELGIKIRLN
ncbi:MAG: hypothetical protein ACOYXT_29890 [Bacteroidota bacterium]